MKTKNLFVYSMMLLAPAIIVSCGSDDKNAATVGSRHSVSSEVTQPSPASVVSTTTPEDGPAIATIETEDYILKIHKAVPFELKPKSYQPFKVAPDTKLVVLDVSVRNKLSTPLDFAKILGSTVLKGSKSGLNMLAPWVVAAYIVDYPYPNHQKEYDALWSTKFEPNGFHRAMLIGLNPKKDEKNFSLIVPVKPDYNNPSRKTASFSIE